MSEPAQNYRIVGSGNVEFGTEGVGYLTIGVILSADRSDTGDKLELKDRQGNVFVVIYFNDKGECSFDAIFDTEAELPVRGDGIDVCGLVGVLVDDIKHKWQEGKDRGVTITGTKYNHLTPSA